MSDYINRYAALNVINDAIANNALSYESCVNEIIESIAKIPAADVQPGRHGQMTNADKIRAMTDETMAKWLAKSEYKHWDFFAEELQKQAHITVEYPRDETKLTEEILKWLKEEVSE